MKAVIQRVKNCSVHIENELYSSIDKGILVLFCVEKGDTSDKLEWIKNKILGLRLFEDENGKMNKSLIDVQGELMIVSQFTLAADCKKGTRPSFDNAESPDIANSMYEAFVKQCSETGVVVKTGKFGAMMDICLCNDGPVTFVLTK